MNNPFTPNFGQAPLYIAGRSFLTGEIERALDRGLGDPALASILVGPRGTGKTALLSHLGSYAEGHGSSGTAYSKLAESHDGHFGRTCCS